MHHPLAVAGSDLSPNTNPLPFFVDGPAGWVPGSSSTCRAA